MQAISNHIIIFILLSFLLIVIALLTTRSGKARLAIVILYTSLIIWVFVNSSDLLGRAKPIVMEWLAPKIDDATVLNGHLIEQKGIFLTLVWGENEPRLFIMPWDEKAAQEMGEAQQEAAEKGTRLKIRKPFETTLDKNEPLFYVDPQQKLPDKPVPAKGIELETD